MEEFDFTHIDDYTVEQLADFVIADKTTVQELYEEGLYLYHRPKLLKELEARENIAWKETVTNGTIDAIDDYIAVFDQPSPHYRESNVEEAKELRTQLEQVSVTKDVQPDGTKSDDSIKKTNEMPDTLSMDCIQNGKNKYSEDSYENTIESYQENKDTCDKNDYPNTWSHYNTASTNIRNLKKSPNYFT